MSDLYNALVDATTVAWTETREPLTDRLAWFEQQHRDDFPVLVADTVITDAEPGAWGPGSGSELSPRAAKAIFGLADLARNTSTETWADARSGAEMFNRAQ